MAKIGKLTAIVTADTAKFSRGMRAAQNVVRNFSSTSRATLGAAATSIGNIMKNTAVAAGVAAAAATAATVVMVKHSFEAVDKLAKTADALGITTEALGGFRHVADLAGVGAEEFDGALQRMLKSIDAAGRGSKKALVAFQALNINPTKLGLLSTENQMKAIADALERVEDPGKRAAIAMRIFGEAGARMTNVLAGGAEALAAGQAEAEKLGLTISRIDAAKIEIANDSVTRLKAVLTGAAQAIAVQLAPWVAGAAKALTEMGISGQGAGKAVVSVVKAIAIGTAKLWDVVDMGKIAWQGMQAAGAKALQGILWPLEKMAEAMQALIDLAADYLPESLVTAARQATDTITGIRGDLDKFAADRLEKIDEILVGKSASERVQEFFRDAEAAAAAEAQAIADAAEKKIGAQEAYTASILDSIAANETSADIADKAAEQPERSREDLKLLVAGTAEAQAFVFDAANRRQEDLAQKTLTEEKKQTNVLEDIADGIDEIESLAPVFL